MKEASESGLSGNIRACRDITFISEKLTVNFIAILNRRQQLLGIFPYKIMDKQGSQSGAEPKNPMTKEDASRIQSAEAKQHGGGVPKGSFASRAQSTADKRAGNIHETDKLGSQSGGEPKNPMTPEAASRIQSAEAKQHGGGVPKGSFASRAQSTADKRAGNIHETDKLGSQSGGEPKNPMTQEAASHIQSAEAKQHGGGVPEGSFASSAQSTTDKRANQSN